MEFARLAEQISQQDALEWAGLITGLIYVFLATYERPSCWIFGIISSACIAWKSYFDYRLMADVALQLFYVGIGFYGLWQWMKGSTDAKPKTIQTTPAAKHILLIAIVMLVSWPVSGWLIEHAGARYGYPDTLLTLLSVWATFLLVRKDLHNWIYWIGIDLVYTFLYWGSEGYLFALLFFIYAGISVWGYTRWHQEWKTTVQD